MPKISCPHCTFLNEPNRLKCTMCLRYVRKRERTNQDLAEEQSSSFCNESEKTDGSSAEFSKALSPLAPPSMCVLSLFSTASGKSIQVSEAALRNARAKYDLFKEDNIITNNKKDTNISSSSGGEHKDSVSGTDDAIAERSTATVEETPRSHNRDIAVEREKSSSSFTEVAISKNRSNLSELTSQEIEKQPPDLNKNDEPSQKKAADEKIRRAPTNTGLNRPLRKGFVPPRMLSDSSSSLENTRPSEGKGRNSGGNKTTWQQKKVEAKKLAPLSFLYRIFTSTAPLRLPEVELIADGRFHFTRDDCGEALRGLFGFPDACAKDDGKDNEKKHEKANQNEFDIHPSRWRRMLLNLGAHAQHCTEAWCGEMMIAAMLQVREICSNSSLRRSTQLSSSSSAAISLFTPTSTAICLCLRYNREIVEGDRPLLRKITEGDVSAAALAILSVVGICTERNTPHTRIIRVSDGFYHLKASLDIPLSNLVREGALSVGRKIAVCGARCLLRSPCPPTDCLKEVVFSYNYNCVRPVSESSRLGFCLFEPPPLAIGLVHPQGGLVPALEGVVARVLPPFFVVQTPLSTAGVNGEEKNRRFPNSTTPSANSIKTIRNLASQRSYECSLSRENNGVVDENAPQAKVSCVSSILIRCEGGEALIQHWKDLPELHRTSSNMDESSEDSHYYYSQLPTEGSTVVVYGLNPSRSQSAAAPFMHAKLFYASRALHYQPRKNADPSSPYLRTTYSSLSMGENHLEMGRVVDLAGVFVGAQKTRQGTFFLFLLSDGRYAILQVPLPSPTRAILLDTPCKAEGGVVVVLNATFICYEDSQCGSDCARLFANEYTLLSRRAIAELSAQSKAFERGAAKYAARRAEIFRCAAEAPGGGGHPAPTPNGSNRTNYDDNDTGGEGAMGVENRPLSRDAEPPPPLSTIVSDGRRVPYYLRENQPPKPSLNRGVVFPKPVMEVSKSIPANSPISPATQVDGNSKSYYHFYGNIIEMAFASIPNKVSSLPRNEGSAEGGEEAIIFCENNTNIASYGVLLKPEIANPQQSRQLTRICKVKWRFGSACEVAKGEIRDAAMLDSLLEPCISAQTLITMSTDACNIEFSIQRTELLNRWRSSKGFWWKLFTQSCVSDTLNPAQRPTENEKEFAFWLQSEWIVAQKLIKDALSGVLFKFTLRENVVERVFYVTNNCFVSQMF